MATYLAHVLVLPGREAEFEAIVATLYQATHEREPGVRRYEYWRGEQERTYYALASFDDFSAFIDHQTSEHHEAAGPKLKDVIETIRFEWLDPMGRAAPLPSTEMQPLRPGASALAAKYQERFAVEIKPWWRRLR